MASLPGVPDPEGRVLHGFEHNEDAVILRTPPAGMALVQTVDVLSPLGNNPRLFGQVAAANALSDVYAVGGVPWSAMNIAAFPAQDVPLEVFWRAALKKSSRPEPCLPAGIRWKTRKSNTVCP